MVAYTIAQRLTPNTALIGAGALGVFAALVAALMPGAMLESLVVDSGIAAFVAAAEPPLGFTARLCLGVVAGGSVAVAAWFALSALIDLLQRAPALEQRVPTVRRADAHPDAPPREPLRAGRDLGFELPAGLADEPLDLLDLALPPEPVIARGTPTPAPFVAPVAPEPVVAVQPAAPTIQRDPVVQPLPQDLDQPLASFDPGAVPAVPLAAPRPVAPLVAKPARAPIFAEGERFETFALTPAPAPTPIELSPAEAPIASAPAAPSAITGPETVATVHSLLDRLERGIARRGQAASAEPAPEPTQGLESTLEKLRRMAARG